MYVEGVCSQQYFFLAASWFFKSAGSQGKVELPLRFFSPVLTVYCSLFLSWHAAVENQI